MIVYKGSDEITVFLNTDYMLNWLEAFDVENDPPEVFSSRGEKITLKVLPTGSIKAEFSDASPRDQAKFRKYLQRFTKKILESGARSRVLKNEEICELIAAMFAIDSKS